MVANGNKRGAVAKVDPLELSTSEKEHRSITKNWLRHSHKCLNIIFTVPRTFVTFHK